MAVTFNASTSSGLVTTADNSGQIAFQSNGTQFNPLLTATTAKAYNWNGSTTNTFLDFDTIPSWVKRITVMLSGVSTSGTSSLLLQLGSTTFVTSGYDSLLTYIASNGTSTGAGTATAGYIINIFSANTDASTGSIVIENITSNTWVVRGIAYRTGTNKLAQTICGAALPLGGILDRIRITTVNGTDTFDAGTINILYE